MIITAQKCECKNLKVRLTTDKAVCEVQDQFVHNQVHCNNNVCLYGVVYPLLLV